MKNSNKHTFYLESIRKVHFIVNVKILCINITNPIFLLVVVMVTDKETKVAKPVAYLYKGMTFGVSTWNLFLNILFILYLLRVKLFTH